MRAPKIDEVKKLATECGVDGAICIVISAGKFAITSYGRDKSQCRRMASVVDQIADGIKAKRITVPEVGQEPAKPQRQPGLRMNSADIERQKAAVQDAVEQAERIIEMTEELPEAGWSFGESVAEKCRKISENIERHGRVSPAQQEALDNMEDGVARWFHD